jgi:uncharacterized protein YjiS (DUF1127 family)
MRFLQRRLDQSTTAHHPQPGLSIGCNQQETQMGIRQTLKRWAAYQQTVRELASLDNRQLNDLGIARTDIQKIARDNARAL